jgi:signal transduction histidine kinase
MLLVFLLFFAIGVFVIFAPSMIGLLTGADLAELEPAAQEFLILHRRIWPAVLIILVGVFVYTLLFSHRIAGPIYRINHVLQMMLQGKYPGSLTLRKGDHFHQTAELLERLSQQLAHQHDTGAPGKPTGPGTPENTE